MHCNKKIILVALILSVFTVGVAQAAPIVIRFAHAVTDNTPKGQMALKLKELVDERLKGKYIVEVHPNSSMFNDDQIFEALLLDDAQLGAPSLSKFTKYTDKLQIFDLPFLFKDIEAVDRFQETPEAQALLESIKPRGLLGLGYLHNGLKQLSATKKLVSPSDAEGLKFRIMSSAVLEAQFNAVGAEALKRPFSQVYDLLSAKVVDGQENTWSNIYSKKFYAVQPYITESNHGVVDYMVVTSVDFWESLPEEDAKVLKAAVHEAIAFGNNLAKVKAVEDKQKVANSQQTEIIQLTAAQRQEWIEAMRPVWTQFERQIGREIINKAYEMNN